MAREINLVPDIKNDMIKALKLRNMIFFIAIVVASASVGVTLITALTMVGQQAALDSKAATITKLSDKLNSYADLKDFLTIRNQVGDIADITSEKKVFSRTFNVLSAMIPNGADTIKISELNVDLSEEAPTFAIEAQANAGQEPYIDYNVLDAFKKSLNYIHYDYGEYVDKNNNKIPAYCMIEAGNDGAVFNDPDRGYYALWTIDAEGCATSITSENSSSEDSEDAASSSTAPASSKYQSDSYEDYDGQRVVRIWRTPQFNQWYKTTETEGQPYMGLDGTISGVEHFNSSCITYSGEENSGSNSIKWTDRNDSCLIVPEGENGITISFSSNGRDENNELVLRFSSSIVLDPEVFNFKNTHMLAIAPSGRRNVTDSYVQIQTMFSERATDCAQGDTSCTNNSVNSGGNQGTNGSNNSQQNNNQNQDNTTNSSERNQNG